MGVGAAEVEAVSAEEVGSEGAWRASPVGVAEVGAVCEEGGNRRADVRCVSGIIEGAAVGDESVALQADLAATHEESSECRQSAGLDGASVPGPLVQ